MIPVFSILCIVLAIAVGYFRRVNIGTVSIAFAFLTGHFLAHPHPGREDRRGWPSGCSSCSWA